MRVVGGRAFTVVLLCGMGVAAPDALLACDRDCSPSPNPVEIGVLPGYQQSRVRQISNGGDIVGQAVRTSGEPTQQAVLWHKARGPLDQAEVLPPLEGFVRGDARGFATHWTPVGMSYTPGVGTRAVAWKMDWTVGQRVAVDLAPPAGFTDAQALSGNGIGLVAGDAWNPKELANGLAVRHAVVWRLTWDGGAEVCDLGVPDGYLTSSANDVNAFGYVAGTAVGRLATGGLVTAAFVWRPLGRPQHCRFEAIPLTAAAAAPKVQAPAINERGDVVARADSNAPVLSRALIWRYYGRRYAEPQTLPLPEGFADALARAINAHGDIVGTAQKRNSKGAVTETSVALWRWTLRGWTSSVLTSPSNTAIINSEYLNDRGDVIADTSVAPTGSSGAYLWVKATQRRICTVSPGLLEVPALEGKILGEAPESLALPGAPPGPAGGELPEADGP